MNAELLEWLGSGALVLSVIKHVRARRKVEYAGATWLFVGIFVASAGLVARGASDHSAALVVASGLVLVSAIVGLFAGDHAAAAAAPAVVSPAVVVPSGAKILPFRPRSTVAKEPSKSRARAGRTSQTVEIGSGEGPYRDRRGSRDTEDDGFRDGPAVAEDRDPLRDA